MLLLFSDGQPFASGAVPYEYRPVTEQDSTPRLLVWVDVEGLSTLAALDTGAPYLVCAPDVARHVRPDPRAALGQTRLLVRGHWFAGHFHRMRLGLRAAQGEGMALEVTAFVPEPEAEEAWGALPSFLGLTGCLERLRFAVDPSTDTFYFGPLT